MRASRSRAKKALAYHFVGKTLRDGRPVPADGEWLIHKGPLVMCGSGFHASKHPLDALRYAPGSTLCLVELGGRILQDTDKVCARRRKIIRRFDATELLRRFAREQALSVIHLWEAPDVVRRYLETGDESLRAAAGAAAWPAAWAAAGAAAWDAAGAAAWAAWAAAGAAAGAAAWDAAGAAAWDAAGAAAGPAAWDAARTAARDAAWAARAAARNAAWDAAWPAAWDAAHKQFAALVDAEFKQLMANKKP